ncbi:MAG: hypothetical protein ACR2OX_12600 [Methyloligellaceae bacterium]
MEPQFQASQLRMMAILVTSIRLFPIQVRLMQLPTPLHHHKQHHRIGQGGDRRDYGTERGDGSAKSMKTAGEYAAGDGARYATLSYGAAAIDVSGVQSIRRNIGYVADGIIIAARRAK